MKSAVYIITLIVLIILYPGRSSVFNHEYNFGLSIIYLFLLIYFFIKQKKYTKNWLRVDVLFLIGYTIVHLQIPFLASIGIEPNNPGFIWINKMVVNFATWMSVVAITFWMLGYTLMMGRKLKRPKLKLKSFKINYTIFDAFLLITFLAFIGLVGSSVFEGTYDGTASWGAGSTYIYILLTSLLYIRIIYFIKETPKQRFFSNIIKQVSSNKIFIAVLTVFTLMFLLSGNRGPVFRVALSAAGSYVIFIKPIKFKQLIAFILIGAFTFTLIGLGRGRDATAFGDKSIFERGYYTYQENKDEINITNELATSVRIQYMALDIVPDKHPYLYGTTFLMQSLSAVPFLTSTVKELFNVPRMYLSTSNFFTILSLGPNPTWGLGSEILADIYVNFGLYGTFIVMLLFGMFISYVTRKSFDHNMIYVIILIALLFSSLSINRGMLFTPLQEIVFLLIINYFFTKVIGKV